jgi:hypothetical protein
MIKYAVMVPFGNDDYIYVTKPTENMYEVEPVLHETLESAQESASIWGNNAKIVEYKGESNA